MGCLARPLVCGGQFPFHSCRLPDSVHLGADGKELHHIVGEEAVVEPRDDVPPVREVPARERTTIYVRHGA